MILRQPTPREERWLTLAARLTDAPYRDFLSRHTGGWRQVGLITRLAFFALGIVMVSLTVTILSLLNVPASALVAGVLLLMTGEWLIASRRLDRAGIEEALIAAGLSLTAYWLIDEFARYDTRSMAALACLAMLLAGRRLRNPLFTTLAALCASLLVALLFDDQGWFFARSGTQWATVFCYAVASAALAFGARQLERPSHDRMLDWLVVAMPVAGYIWMTIFFGFRSTTDLSAALGPLTFGIVALVVGLRRRTHAPLWSCMACIGCLGLELRGVTGWTLTTRLLVWGIATLIVAIVLNRWLRQPRAGITSQRCDEREGPLDLLSLGGAAAIVPQSAAAEPRGMQGGGGGFGGGGAGGRF